LRLHGQSKWRIAMYRIAWPRFTVSIRALVHRKRRRAWDQAGCAGGHGQRPVPVPGDRGLGFLHAARERRPLDELAGIPLTPLRSVRYTSARSSSRSPATPDAGPLKSAAVLAPARS